ncbi:hypothetical protein ACFWPU_01105 [Streptomyces sp. NPDC058471]|uniref:hypothetical protein n=1 Tax=Streptomyces sp. NPDC058471 TaxID=3346516 RepID=UPI0036532C23
MTAHATQNIVDAGTNVTYNAVSTSDTAEVGNGVNTFLHYKNTDATTEAITIVVPGNTSYGEPNPDVTLTIGANTGELLIPLRKIYDAGDGTGRCTMTMASTTGITLAVVRMG